MATIRCPHSHQWISTLGNLTVINCEVEIHNNICDHCDKCGYESCEFYDDTPEGTRLYLKGLGAAHASIEGMKADEQIEKQLRARFTSS